MEILMLRLNNDISYEYLNQVLPFLPKEMKTRYENITNDKYFVSSLVGYLMIAWYLKKKYHRLILPLIENGRSKDIKECFSISHSNELVCVAFDSSPIGIDVEKKRQLSRSLIKRLSKDGIDPIALFTKMEASFKLDNNYHMLDEIPPSIDTFTIDLGEYYISIAKYK